jgi:hypothetical protein
MKRLRIIATRIAAPKRPAPLPEDVERLLPYTTDAYGPLTTPVQARAVPRRRSVVPWIGFAVLALSSFATIGLAITILATRPGTPVPVDAPAQRLHAQGTRGNNTLNCLADDLRVSVADEGAGDGVLVGTLGGTNASLVFTLAGGAGGYMADITSKNGVLRSTSAVRGQPMTVRPGETLLLKVDGVAEARRLRVTGGPSVGASVRAVCQ